MIDKEELEVLRDSILNMRPGAVTAAEDYYRDNVLRSPQRKQNVVAFTPCAIALLEVAERHKLPVRCYNLVEAWVGLARQGTQCIGKVFRSHAAYTGPKKLVKLHYRARGDLVGDNFLDVSTRHGGYSRFLCETWQWIDLRHELLPSGAVLMMDIEGPDLIRVSTWLEWDRV